MLLRILVFLHHNDEGTLTLKENHAYLYQVQMEMRFADPQYCDFIVWREGELFIQRILPDTAFIDGAITKVKVFVKTCILPELVGRYYTRPPSIPAVVEATNEEASSSESGSQKVVANNENENQEILDNELHRRFLTTDKVTTNVVDNITDDE